MNSSRQNSSRKNQLILNPAIFALFGPKITDKSLKEKLVKLDKIKSELKEKAKDVLKRERIVTNTEKRVEALKNKQKELEGQIAKQQQMLGTLKKDHASTLFEMQKAQKTAEAKHITLKTTEKSAKNSLKTLEKKQKQLSSYELVLKEKERNFVSKERKLRLLLINQVPLRPGIIS